MTKDKYRRSSYRMPSESDEEQDFDEDASSEGGCGLSCQQPQQRNAANARERARMRVLSKAFCRLKTTLPWVPADTKLSKLDTLRLATSYISHLRAILNLSNAVVDNGNDHHATRPINLSWPFNNHFYLQTNRHSFDKQTDVTRGKSDGINNTDNGRKFSLSNCSNLTTSTLKKNNSKFSSHCFCVNIKERAENCENDDSNLRNIDNYKHSYT